MAGSKVTIYTWRIYFSKIVSESRVRFRLQREDLVLTPRAIFQKPTEIVHDSTEFQIDGNEHMLVLHDVHGPADQSIPGYKSSS
jgi:hypothetical protein